MIARALLLGLCVPVFATELPKDVTEETWIATRNQMVPADPYPAGFDLDVDRVTPPAPETTWTFWKGPWERAARDWTRGLYVAFKLDNDGHPAAARNEIPHLTLVLARLNGLATHTAAHREQIERALERVTLGGLREAVRAARMAGAPATPRYLEIVRALTERVGSDQTLREATDTVARVWKRHDAFARGLREQQAIGLGFVAGAATAIVTTTLGDASPLYPFLAFFTTTLAANELPRAGLPFVRRFDWRENMVRDPVAKCEAYLENESVGGHPAR